MPGRKKHFCKVPNCDFWSYSMVGTSFLRTSDSVAMKERADAVGLAVDDILPYFRICHKHFEDSDFIIGDNFKRLKQDAVPSKFLVSSFTSRILHIFLIFTVFENYSKYLFSNFMDYFSDSCNIFNKSSNETFFIIFIHCAFLSRKYYTINYLMYT